MMMMEEEWLNLVVPWVSMFCKLEQQYSRQIDPDIYIYTYYIAKNSLCIFKKNPLWHRLSGKNKLLLETCIWFISYFHTLWKSSRFLPNAAASPEVSKLRAIRWFLTVFTASNAPKVHPTSKIRGTQNQMVSYWRYWNVSFPFGSNKFGRFLIWEDPIIFPIFLWQSNFNNEIPNILGHLGVFFVFLLSFRRIFRRFLNAPFRWVCETPWAVHLWPQCLEEKTTHHFRWKISVLIRELKWIW